MSIASMKQDRIERNSKLYMKLSVQVNTQIRVLQEQKANAAKKKNDPSLSEVTRAVWSGMHTAYNNALSELELANDRAHYNS